MLGLKSKASSLAERKVCGDMKWRMSNRSRRCRRLRAAAFSRYAVNEFFLIVVIVVDDIGDRLAFYFVRLNLIKSIHSAFVICV